jgi:hypothetical protein
LFLARFEQDAKEQEEKRKEEVGARSWVCARANSTRDEHYQVIFTLTLDSLYF